MRTYSSLVSPGVVLATWLTAVSFTHAADPVVRPRPSSGLKSRIVAPLSQQIVMTAEKFKGQKVGRGECTDFVSEVLRLCNCKGVFDDTFVFVENKKAMTIPTYGWGKSTNVLKGRKAIMPKAGEIIQFHSCRFEDGRGGSWQYGVPHHTAIVKSANGTMLTLLHQNVDGSLDRSQVREQQIDLSWLKSGRWRSYEALPQ